jgi:hypothetical protein
VFYRVGYGGAATIVAAGLGHAISLIAEWWRPGRRPAWRDGWAFGLTGAGHVSKRIRADGSLGEGWNGAPHNPMVRVKDLGAHSSRAEFTVCPHYEGRPAGKWVTDLRTGKTQPYRGRFVDILGPAYALDGRDSDALDEHCDAFGISPTESPVAVTVDAEGIDAVVAACEATWRLALAVDAEASRWAGA